MNRSPRFIPTWCWHTQLKMVVQVLKRGHFEGGTIMVQLPNDLVIETDEHCLEDYDQVMQRSEIAEVGE